MELTPEKTIRTRRGFVAGLTGVAAPESHVTAHLVSSSNGSDLIIKSGEDLYKRTTGEGVEDLTSQLTSLNYGALSEGPGYFSVYGGEVYFCQSSDDGDALFSYDGNTARNLGVPGLFGDYDGAEPFIRSSVDFSGGADYCAWYCKNRETGAKTPEVGYNCRGNQDSPDGEWDGNCGFGDTINTDCQPGAGPATCDASTEDTYLCMPQQGTIGGTYCWHVAATASEGDEEARGEKILNCAFKMSFYDAKRNIYGRACQPRSVIKFGPNRNNYALYQYQIVADLPAGRSDDGYDVAIWCSVGQEVLTVKVPGGTNSNFHATILYDEVHGMSKHLTDMMFLEDIVRDGVQAVNCGDLEDNQCCLFKDQSTLADSGQYTEQYEMPVPSKAMAILPGGTALYLFPKLVKGFAAQTLYSSAIETGDPYDLGDHRPGVEYSVGHPEQIGRDTFNQKETFSSLPSLRGAPMYAMNASGSSLLFTRQSVYQLGFDRSPQVREVGGPGVLNHKSIHPTSNGVMYVADEGPVWFQGNKAVEILRELKFDGWLDPLTQQQRKQIRIGLIEDCKRLLMAFPVEGTTDRFKFLMHDFGDGFTSEWWIGSDQQYTPDTLATSPGSNTEPEYMLSHKGDDGYSFYLWLGGTCYKYDPTISSSLSVVPGAVTSYLEFWVNENCHLEKQLGEVVLHLGRRSGDFTIRVSTFENPNDKGTNNSYATIEERTRTVQSKNGNRVAMPDFSGMRGKYFRISIESSDVDIEVIKVVADIKYDEDPRTDDTKNVLSTFGSPSPK